MTSATAIPARPAGALALLVVSLLVALPASAPAALPAAAPALKKGLKSGICIAQIAQKGKLVKLRVSTYRYQYKRIRTKGKKARFRRRIIKVNAVVKTSCLTQCVQVSTKGGKEHPVFRKRKIWVRLPSKRTRGRLVKAKKLRRVWLLGPCASLPSIETLGTPVTITLLEPSSLTFDFTAFKRRAPLTGTLKGYVPGKIVSEADNQVILTSGAFSLGRTTMFTDKVCGGQPSDSIRTGDPSTVRLNPGKQSTLTIGADGRLTAITYMLLGISYELRNGDDGCANPYVTTGYSNASETVGLSGTIGQQGLARTPLKMAATEIDLLACMAPGPPTQPCSGFQVPLPSTISMDLIASVVAGP